MDPKRIALLAGAGLIAIASTYMAFVVMRGTPAPKAVAAIIPQQDTGPQILVATKPLPVGTIIDPTAMRFQPWPRNMVDGAYYVKGKTDINRLAGTVVRTTITVGQPITNGALVAPGDRGFLAAALGPGMRAVTFPVTGLNGSQGVAGFVFPGDRVDLLLTQGLTSTDKFQSLKTSETIIRNLRVLATDQHAQGAVDDKGNRTIAPFTNVTVEATPRMAEKITVAQALGTLSLSLRSIADTQADLERAIAKGDVVLPKGDPAAEKRMVLEFAAHPIDNQVSFVTGGDVSHFQRKSVPATNPDDNRTLITPQLRSGGNSPRTALGIEPFVPKKVKQIPVPTPPAPPTVRVSRGNTQETVIVGEPKASGDALADAVRAQLRAQANSVQNAGNRFSNTSQGQ